MSIQLKIIPERCIGCRSCELACSLENDDILCPADSRINVISFIESPAHGMPYHLPLTCYQCSDAPCIKVCPEDALKRNSLGPGDDPNVVQLDTSKCTNCRQCEKACPFGAIRWKKQFNQMIKCELCGGMPACVEICPSQAILFESADPFLAREKAFKQRAYEVLKKG